MCSIRVRSISAWLLLVLATGCTSTQPSPPGGSPTTIVRGTLVDAVDGAPVVGGSLTVQGRSESAISDGVGAFALPIPAGAAPVVDIAAHGYLTRTTRVAESGSQTEIDLLADGKGFNLAFFDYVFRRAGGICTPPGGLGTTRWITQPVVQVWTTEFSCEREWPQSPGGCLTIRATGRPAPSSFLKAVREAVAADIPAYTGNALRDLTVIDDALPTGTQFRHPADTLLPGRITVAYVDDRRASVAALAEGGTLGISAAHVQILGAGFSDAGPGELIDLVSHELAHAVGFYHPCGGSYTPLASTMRSPSRPTEADRLHGRILYKRPSWSRSADIDPDGFVINRP